MKFEWFVKIALLVMLGLSGGCGTLDGFLNKTTKRSPQAAEPSSRKGGIPQQERYLAGALEHLRKGNEQGARDLLERICEAPSVGGVTDDALFRLSLLNLRDDSAKSQALLERLRNEFPRSIWTYQAAPLASYLSGIKTLRDRQREMKTLRDLNLSLSRDNRDLRQTIERLKNLDIELEQKIKR
ncbi:MAG: hypothetical protein CXR30_02830 [Geobacter sp.]|nr:MAG: hypothetical protein CXR30_02830 [Geobacter sp.]